MRAASLFYAVCQDINQLIILIFSFDGARLVLVFMVPSRALVNSFLVTFGHGLRLGLGNSDLNRLSSWIYDLETWR